MDKIGKFSLQAVLSTAWVAAVCVGMASEALRFPAALEGEWELVPESSDEVPTSSVLFDSDPESVLARDRWRILTAKRVRFDAGEEAIGMHYNDTHYVDVILGRVEFGGWKVNASVRSNRLVVRSSRAGVRGKETIELKSDGSTIEIKVFIDGLRKTLSATRTFRRAKQ